jgi:hypothetical protein
MMAGMALLSTRFALTLFPPPALPRIPSQSVGGRRFGGVGGILLARRQLSFQIGDLFFGVGDLLFGVGDLPIPIGYLLTEIFNLTLLPLDLPL